MQKIIEKNSTEKNVFLKKMVTHTQRRSPVNFVEKFWLKDCPAIILKAIINEQMHQE